MKPADRHAFANEHIELNSENTKLDLKKLVNFYEGYLAEEPETSYASGSIIDGVFYGTINSKKDGKFFIEPSRRYNSTLDAHSIIYNENHINLNKTKLGMFKRAIDSRTRRSTKFNQKLDVDEEESFDTGCGSTKRDVKEAMRREQRELYEERIRTEVCIKLPA